MKIVRALTGLLAVVLIIVGVAVAALLGPDDTWAGEMSKTPADHRVVTTDPGLLNVAGFDLAVTAEADEGEVFVGASHPVHVEDYLQGVQRTRVTELGADGVAETDTVKGEQAQPSADPGDLDVWTEQVSGEGAQHLSVPLTDESAVEVLAMPATGQEAPVRLGIGYALPGAFVGGIVAAGLGVLLLVGVVVLGRRARRAGASVPTTATGAEPVATSGSAAGEKSVSGAPVSRVVAVGAVSLLATGCGIPHQVDHGETPGVVPLSGDEAPALVAEYDERNNRAIAASHEGDGSLWSGTDSGPHLAVDELEARANEVVPPKGEPSELTTTAGEVYEVPQPAYPLWALVETTTRSESGDEDGDDDEDMPTLEVYTKARAHSAWKGTSGVPVAEGDLPTPLPAEEARPTESDLERADEVDRLFEGWLEKGSAEGLSVPADLEEDRTSLAATEKGIKRVALSARAWGGSDDRTGQEGSVRALRVEEGLLLLTDQELVVRAYLESDYVWTPSKETVKIYGKQHEHLVNRFNFVTSAAILVPDSGEARVIGSTVRRIIDVPKG